MMGLTGREVVRVGEKERERQRERERERKAVRQTRTPPFRFTAEGRCGFIC